MITDPNRTQQRDPADFGFPVGVVVAFLRAADELDAVIMTRAPGEAATTIIDERYDLKGFSIKAKSCNWGPMAGFVCSNPLLRKKDVKKGVKGAAKQNVDYHDAYIKTLRSMLEAAENRQLDQWDAPAVKGHYADDNAVKARAFVPLKISNARLSELQSRKLLPSLAPGLFAGIATDDEASPSVVAEYLLVNEGAPLALWGVYVRNIYVATAPGTFVKMEGDPFAPTPRQEHKPEHPDQLDEAYSGLKKDAPWRTIVGSIPEGAATDRYFAVYGACNPYRPYKPAGPDGYKNTVTGDYDFFAVWPVLTLRPPKLEHFVRACERTAALARGDPTLTPPPRRFFLPVNEKRFTVQSAVSGNVFIEFIPFPGEAARLEDPEVGNINEAVEVAAQTLNAFVTLRYGSHRSPNVAFHGDEGGRPDVSDIDLPIGVFLPTALTAELARQQPPPADGERVSRVRVLDKNEQLLFLQLILELKDRCYLFLHYRWIADLVSLAIKYHDGDDAHQRLSDALRAGLADLFLPGGRAADAADARPLLALTRFFQELPTFPLEIPNPPNALKLVYRALDLEFEGA